MNISSETETFPLNFLTEPAWVCVAGIDRAPTWTRETIEVRGKWQPRVLTAMTRAELKIAVELMQVFQGVLIERRVKPVEQARQLERL